MQRLSELFVSNFRAIDGSARLRHDLLIHFEILGDISEVETFATGSGIREVVRLRRDVKARIKTVGGAYQQ